MNSEFTGRYRMSSGFLLAMFTFSWSSSTHWILADLLFSRHLNFCTFSCYYSCLATCISAVFASLFLQISILPQHKRISIWIWHSSKFTRTWRKWTWWEQILGNWAPFGRLKFLQLWCRGIYCSGLMSHEFPFINQVLKRHSDPLSRSYVWNHVLQP